MTRLVILTALLALGCSDDQSLHAFQMEVILEDLHELRLDVGRIKARLPEPEPVEADDRYYFSHIRTMESGETECYRYDPPIPMGMDREPRPDERVPCSDLNYFEWTYVEAGAKETE